MKHTLSKGNQRLESYKFSEKVILRVASFNAKTLIEFQLLKLSILNDNLY